MAIEFYHPITLRVLHPVPKDRRPLLLARYSLQRVRQSMAIEDVVPQNQGDSLATDECAANDERLGKPCRLGLFGIRQRYAPLATVPQQLTKERQMLRGRDDENVTNPGQH